MQPHPGAHPHPPLISRNPPPLLWEFIAKANCSHFILTGFIIGMISSLKKRISYCLLFMNIAYYLSIVNVLYRRYRRMYCSGFLVNSFTGLHNANRPLFFILSYNSTWFHCTLRFCFLSLFSFCLFLFCLRELKFLMKFQRLPRITLKSLVN